MEGKKVEKPRRSHSQKLLGMLENTLKLPTKMNRSSSHSESHSDSGDKDYSQDTPNPTKLPIMRSYSTKTAIKKNCQEYESKFNDHIISSEGKLRYEAMLQLLTCCHCDHLASTPMSQCRKGHVYCKSCKVDNKITTCKVCKQTFVDAPNVAFDKLVTFIALPCKYGSRGCSEYVFLHSRLDHETFCHFRPVSCQYSIHGCTSEFSYKDICWHHKICSYANFPHANVLPNMPSRKKSNLDGRAPVTTICRPTTPTTPAIAAPSTAPAALEHPTPNSTSLEPPSQPKPTFPLPSQPTELNSDEPAPDPPSQPDHPVQPTRKKAVKSHPVEVSTILDSARPTSPSITIDPPAATFFIVAPASVEAVEAGAENGIEESLPALEPLEPGMNVEHCPSIQNGDDSISVTKPADHVVLPSTGLLNDGIYGFPTAV